MISQEETVMTQNSIQSPEGDPALGVGCGLAFSYEAAAGAIGLVHPEIFFVAQIPVILIALIRLANRLRTTDRSNEPRKKRLHL